MQKGSHSLSLKLIVIISISQSKLLSQSSKSPAIHAPASGGGLLSMADEEEEELPQLPPLVAEGKRLDARSGVGDTSVENVNGRPVGVKDLQNN